MTYLAMMHFDNEGIFANPVMGLWMFLSIGAVALFVVFIPLTSWIEARRREREAFYKADSLRRIAESSAGGAQAALDLLQQQDRMQRMKSREGVKIGGLVNLGVGIALLIFLRALIPHAPIYLCGLIPAFVGVALLVYGLFLAPRIE